MQENKIDYTTEFETFWKGFPSRWNMNLSCFVKRKKWPAFVKWQKLPQVIRDECQAKVRKIKASEGTPRDCVTWLNQRGWDDIELEKPKPLPAHLVPKMKTVPEHKVNVNNERNKQAAKLKG